jgi:hypothetical protein
MRDLNLGQLEVLLPVGPLFLERSGTVTNLDPARRLIRAVSRVMHVAEVLTLRHRTFTQSSGLNGFEQSGLAAGLDSGSYEIAHAMIISRQCIGEFPAPLSRRQVMPPFGRMP